MFYNDFWEYSFISYFYGINPAQAENPVFYFNVSGTQTSTKSPGNLRASIFGRKKTCGRRKRANGGSRAKRGGPTRPGTVAAWDPPIWASWLRCLRSLLHRHRLDLKTPIKKVPWRFAKGGGGETRNHETERQKAAAGEDRRGETPPESPPEGSTPLRRVHHQHLQQDHLHLSTVNSWQT